MIITPLAQMDIETISDFIGQDDPLRAISFARELLDKCLSLSENPVHFPLAERLPVQNVRKMGHGRYLVFYRVYADRVSVVRVLHGATDYSAKFTSS